MTADWRGINMIDLDKMSNEDTQRALRLWEDYQKSHDVSAMLGKAVGIDPKTGRIWFGEDAREVARNARADGFTSRLLGLRVGEKFYLRKGGSVR
jgi:hypothetical protein